MAKLLNVKNDFPVLVNNPNLSYLDTGATALKPYQVINKLDEYYKEYGVNVNRGVYKLSYQATLEYEETRTLTAKFLNAKEKEIVFTKGATNALNMVALGFGMNYINEGDEIITSELEHHSNVLPWVNVAKKKNAKIKYIPLDSTGRITIEGFLQVLSEKTKVIALTYISNVMGYITPIAEIIKLAHSVGAVVSVDAAQAVPHMEVDVKELDCDFLSFSGHKLCGPTGIGVLYGKKELLAIMPPVEFGGDMADDVNPYEMTYKDAPYRFETGTPIIASAIGLGKACEYIKSIGLKDIAEYEYFLKEKAIEGLKKIPNIVIYNETSETGIIAFNVKDVHPHDAASVFDNNDVCIRAGHHCSQLIIKWLKTFGTLRASFYFYNTLEDVEKFVESVKEAQEFFGAL